jgi:hypothetical protein
MSAAAGGLVLGVAGSGTKTRLAPAHVECEGGGKGEETTRRLDLTGVGFSPAEL